MFLAFKSLFLLVSLSGIAVPLGLMAGPEPSARVDAETVLTRFLARSEQAAALACSYSYQRQRVVEELEKGGVIKSTQRKLFEVVPISGMPYSRLIQIDGRPLSDREAREETGRENQFRENAARGKAKSNPAHREVKLDAALLERFRFELLGEELVNGRMAYQLKFQPREEAIIGDVHERILSQLRGNLWIDQQEWEMAKLEVALQESVQIAWGLIGAVHALSLRVERTRLQDGVWLNAKSNGQIDYRQLLNSKKVQWREVAGHFKRLEPNEPIQPVRAAAAP